ncbi:MAG: TetR/AcrR family transcriptional regulator [Paludibacteraceae bacterium]|nr:TetR/AcrR family transcriptional regulator [Paludibacteraceae bacterium]
MIEQREHIIRTAKENFEHYGIKSVSMDDLSKELGMSKKTLYTHFAQKDDLIECVLAYIRECIEEHISSLQNSPVSIWEQVLQATETLDHIPDVRKIPPLIYDLNKYYPELAKKHNELVEKMSIGATKRFLQRGIDEGIFRQGLDVDITAYFFAHIHGQQIEESVRKQGGQYPPKRMIEAGIDLMLRSILSKEGIDKYEQIRGTKNPQ